MEKFRQLRYNEHKKKVPPSGRPHRLIFIKINRSVGKLGAVYFFISTMMSRMRVKAMISSFIGEHLISEGSKSGMPVASLDNIDR